MKNIPIKIQETDQEIKRRLSELSEAKTIDYHRRVSLAHAAYSEYKNAAMFRKSYENASKKVHDVEFMKFTLFGSAIALFFDWFFFNFSGWSIGVVIVLIPICFGINTILVQLSDTRAFRVSHWMHEENKAGSLAIQSGAGMYEINKVYRIEEEFASENIKEINTHDDALAFSGEKEDAAQLQWNKIYLRILGLIETQ